MSLVKESMGCLWILIILILLSIGINRLRDEENERSKRELLNIGYVDYIKYHEIKKTYSNFAAEWWLLDRDTVCPTSSYGEDANIVASARSLKWATKDLPDDELALHYNYFTSDHRIFDADYYNLRRFMKFRIAEMLMYFGISLIILAVPWLILNIFNKLKDPQSQGTG